MSFCWAAIIEAMTDEIEQFRVNPGLMVVIKINFLSRELIIFLQMDDKQFTLLDCERSTFLRNEEHTPGIRCRNINSK